MVDNVAITAGSGTTIAADDIGSGILAQRVKPVWGPDGTGNDIDVATGKPLPVQVRSATGLIPLGEPTDAKAAQTDTTSVSAISLLKQLSDYLNGNGKIGAVSQGYTSGKVSVTRPANATPYTANDVLGPASGTSAITFPTMGPSAGGEIMITGVTLERDVAAVVTGELNYILHLYNVTPPSALADNAAFDLGSGDRASYLGSINIPTPVDLGSTLYSSVDGNLKQITLASGTLYGYLVTVGAYTPATGTVLTVTLHSVAV
jgi:hypothetical protein